MTEVHTLGLCKEERIYSKKLIDQLFSGRGSYAMSAFPLRIVFRLFDRTEGDLQVEFLISVPKYCFKRAVKRNRVKRQVRDAFRKHKQVLAHKMGKHENRKLAVAFIWQADELYPSSVVEYKVNSLIERIGESL